MINQTTVGKNRDDKEKKYDLNAWVKNSGIETDAILPHPMNAYILNFKLSPENVSTTSIYR